jgi:hypothetical protein
MSNNQTRTVGIGIGGEDSEDEKFSMPVKTMTVEISAN